MNANLSKISLIVPVYNVNLYIRKCIDSIISQSYKNLEIILVDDGSSDDSGKIIDEYSHLDNRIKVIHKSNGGVSSSRNIGISYSTGSYVCFADADDWLEPDYVEYLYDLCVTYEVEAAVTTSMYTTFYEKSTETNSVKVVSGHEAAITILNYKMPIGVYCKMFKKELLDKGVLFEQDLFIGEGFNFNTDAFQKAKKVAIGNRKVYHYRRDNEDSAMTKFNIDKINCALYAIEKIGNKIIKKDDAIVKSLRFANWHTHSDMLFFMYLADAKKHHPDVYSKCYKIARSEAFSAFHVETSTKEKIRAFVTFLYPLTIGFLIKLRRKYHYLRKK